MSTLTDTMALLRSTLATLYPARVVSRDFLDFAQRADTDMQSGVYTAIATGKGRYAQYRGREAQLGTLTAMLIFQARVSEDAPPSACEDLEGQAIDEIETLGSGALPSGIGGLYITGAKTSGQLEHPYCWVAFEIEVQP